MCVLNPGNRYRSYATQDSWCAARRLEEHAVGQLKAHVGRRVTDYYRVSYLYSRRDLGEVVGVVAAGGGAAGAVPCVVGGALGGSGASQEVEEAGKHYVDRAGRLGDTQVHSQALAEGVGVCTVVRCDISRAGGTVVRRGWVAARGCTEAVAAEVLLCAAEGVDVAFGGGWFVCVLVDRAVL